MYRCKDCKHLFEEGEQKKWTEKHGLDSPPYEEGTGCPVCGGAYEEIKPCPVCGVYRSQDHVVCDDCINEFATPEYCFKFSEKEKTEIMINDFIAFVFEPDEIERILLDEIKKHRQGYADKIMQYVDVDRGWFADKIVEEIKNDKK